MPIQKKKWSWNIELGGVTADDVLFLTKHLATVLKSGLTLVEGVEMVEEETGKAHFKSMLQHIREGIESGQSFHEGLAHYPKVFFPLYINLVKTGELSGTLADNLKYLAENLSKTNELRRKVRGALIYPILLLIALVGLGAAIALFVLPQIVPLFKSLEVELPVTTRTLLWIAEGLKMQTPAKTLLFLGGIIVVILLLRRPFFRPFFHRFFLKIPVIGKVIQKLELARFTRTLGLLLKSGIPVDRGLEITADATSNYVYKKALTSFVIAVSKGHPLADALKEYPALFSLSATRMVGVAERTGSLDEMLFYLSQVYEEEVDTTLKNLSTILEPFLLILMGVMVGFIAISILSPIYNITGSLRN